MVVPVVNCMISVKNKKRAALSRAESDKRMSEVNYTFDLVYTVHKAVLYVLTCLLGNSWGEYSAGSLHCSSG